MFLDEAVISAKGGTGGRGCVAFHREKYIAYGGPSGGNGGDGGSVFVMADENTDTLSSYSSSKKFEAEKGQFGLGQNCTGHDGKDRILLVPPGTQISVASVDDPEKFEYLADLQQHGDRIMVAKGGRGGYGNAHFKSSTRQAPDFAELGEPGEHVMLKFELKLVADVGIIGYPSVGKSTLISVISGARPKIADYPFTTLVPNLGVVLVGDRSYVVCDVPGLIEGASEGRGLGHQFLRHIERCGVLLHVLDVSRAMPPEALSDADIDPELLVKDYKTIRTELQKHSPALAEKRELVILNKIDVVGDSLEKIQKTLKKEGIPLFASISAATKNGTQDLIEKLLPIVLEEREKRAHHDEDLNEEDAKKIPVLRPHLLSQKMGAYRVDRRKDGIIIVSGRRLEQFTVMTDFSKPGGKNRFLDVLDRVGIKKAITNARTNDDAQVYIGKVRIDQYL